MSNQVDNQVDYSCHSSSVDAADRSSCVLRQLGLSDNLVPSLNSPIDGSDDNLQPCDLVDNGVNNGHLGRRVGSWVTIAARNFAATISQTKSGQISGSELVNVWLSETPISQHQLHQRKSSVKGLSSSSRLTSNSKTGTGSEPRQSRLLAKQVCQFLLEAGELIKCESSQPTVCAFEDSQHVLYTFKSTDLGERNQFEQDEDSSDSKVLYNRLNSQASESLFCSILVKPSDRRTSDELDFVANELALIPSFEHFSDLIRNQLAECIQLVTFTTSDSLVFAQGDIGLIWYVIYRGSVWVEIEGRGRVCQLGEGDEFGKLALLTDSRRAASIWTAEPQCHLLAVDKTDFNRILRNVEAHLIRLKENNEDVLVISKQTDSSTEMTTSTVKSTEHDVTCSVVAGTLERVILFFLDNTLRDWYDRNGDVDLDQFSLVYQPLTELMVIDQSLEDFFLTLPLFATTEDVLSTLSDYCCDEDSCNKVVLFLLLWCRCLGLQAFSRLHGLLLFTNDLSTKLKSQSSKLHQSISSLLFHCRQVVNSSSTVDTDNDKGSSRNKRPIDLRQSTSSSMDRDSSRIIFPVTTSSKPDRSRPLHSKGLLAGLDLITQVRLTSDVVRLGSIKTKETNGSPAVSSYLNISDVHIIPDQLPLDPKEHQIIYPIYTGTDHDDDNKQAIRTRLPIGATVGEIKARLLNELSSSPANHQHHEDDQMCLVELTSIGDRNLFESDAEQFAFFKIPPSSRLYYIRRDQLKRLVPGPDQLACTMRFVSELFGSEPQLLYRSHSQVLDELTVNQLAAALTLTQLRLATCVSAPELIEYTLGSKIKAKSGPHLHLLVKRFSLLYAWAITQVVSTAAVNHRVQRLKRLIKLASCLISAPYYDQLTAFAIILALVSGPVSRLTHTWTKLPSRWTRCFNNQLQPLVDPQRNHRAARDWLAGLQGQPGLPFLALLLKDLRFSHDANPTHLVGQSRLINFEKMHLIARNIGLWLETVAGFVYLNPLADRLPVTLIDRQRALDQPQAAKAFGDLNVVKVDQWMRSLVAIDDPRLLSQLSHRIESN